MIPRELQLHPIAGKMAGDGGLKAEQQGSEENSSSTSLELAARSEKPVKVLPCPRCESMNTKFCYYNNYSVTQPRHFCRQCQRYWTAGGTLRNVPVGGGSRKKNRHHHHLSRPLTSEPYRCFTTPPPPPPHFQQMLTSSQEILLQQQFPGAYAHPFPPSSSSEPVMYGTGVVVPGGGFFPASSEPPAAFGDGSVVKSESFWPPQGSSMLLNLGLNSHHGRKMVVWDPPAAAAEEFKPSPPVMKINGSSPPHGSSTIEEEGSTPTNGYSNNGYHEEETAVSSMWGTMNEIDTIFQ